MTDLTSFWIMKVPVVSTAHITLETDKWMLEMSNDERDRYMIHHICGGWMIYVGEEPDNIDESFPEDLKKLMAWCQEYHFTWLRLDQDGDLIEDKFPTYDW